jgi:uncharacterized protein with PQ loop repeat
MREVVDVLITIIWFIWAGATLPQIYKVYKRKSAEDLSVVSLWINFLASFVSIFYGIYVKLWPLISVNIFGTFLFSILIGQYYKYHKK